MAGAKDQVQYSLRMKRELYDEVKIISELSKSTMSKFILAAIRSHTARRRRKLQRSLTDSLRILQEYAKKDPEFKEAIQSFADAETSGDASPIEGRFFDVRERKKVQSVDSESLEEFLENA